MLTSDAVKGVKLIDKKDFFCEACQYGKAHRFKFNSKTDGKCWKPGELVHTDVCGPFTEMSLGGARYFLLFVDEATDFIKSDVCEKLKEFDKLVKNEYGYSIKTLRADNGREYVNSEVQNYMKGRGIKLENTAPYTPQQNGKAERKNRTIVESARTMVQARDLPIKLWAEAINTAVYILNRTTIKKNKKMTPFKAWNKKKPELSHIRVFGKQAWTEAYSYIDKQFRKKMDRKAKKLILVG